MIRLQIDVPRWLDNSLPSASDATHKDRMRRLRVGVLGGGNSLDTY